MSQNNIRYFIFKNLASKCFGHAHLKENEFDHNVDGGLGCIDDFISQALFNNKVSEEHIIKKFSNSIPFELYEISKNQHRNIIKLENARSMQLICESFLAFEHYKPSRGGLNYTFSRRISPLIPEEKYNEYGWEAEIFYTNFCKNKIVNFNLWNSSFKKSNFIEKIKPQFEQKIGKREFYKISFNQYKALRKIKKIQDEITKLKRKIIHDKK